LSDVKFDVISDFMSDVKSNVMSDVLSDKILVLCNVMSEFMSASLSDYATFHIANLGPEERLILSQRDRRMGRRAALFLPDSR
jgi:hypothetical protein